jgi:hypothetical protein
MLKTLLAVVLVFVITGVLFLMFSPVLVHTHRFTSPDYRSCGAYNEEGTGITVLNPFRSRTPERTGDDFLRAASAGSCPAAASAKLCSFLKTHPWPDLPKWRLVYRRDSSEDVTLFYRIGRHSQETMGTGCVIAMVDVKTAGAAWQVSGYGISY